MKTFSLFQEIDISIYQWNSGLYDSHKHSFFELIFIMEGEGSQIINKKPYSYQQNDIFLLIPGDEHRIQITAPTRFCVLVFNKTYFLKDTRRSDLANFDQIFKKVEFILQNSSFAEQPIFNDEADRFSAIQLILFMIREHENGMVFSDLIIQNSILQVLCLIARKLRKTMSVNYINQNTDATIPEMMFFIQENIHEPAKLKISALASRFSKSENYLGAYFKASTGLSLKGYILNCKLHLIKQRLEYSDLKINEIAYEFAFTDENHLNKFLKQRLGMTATAYKAQLSKS